VGTARQFNCSGFSCISEGTKWRGSGPFRLAAHDLINRAAVALIALHYEFFSVHAVALHAYVAGLTSGSAILYSNR
jgi:hypothetical protein